MLQEFAVSEQSDEFGQKIRPYISQVQMVISILRFIFFVFLHLFGYWKRDLSFKMFHFVLLNKIKKGVFFNLFIQQENNVQSIFFFLFCLWSIVKSLAH